MARSLRIEYAGGRYHVINRGNFRQELFVEGGAAEAFERALGEAAARFAGGGHAYVVMSNHFHLAIEPTEPNGLDPRGGSLVDTVATFLRNSCFAGPLAGLRLVFRKAEA